MAIESGEGGLGGVVELLGPARELIGKRTIPASHRRCTELSRALALVVILALDESESTRSNSIPSPGSPGVPKTTTAIPLATVESPPPQVHPETLRLRWLVALGADTSVAVGPGEGLGGLVALDGRGPSWSVGIEGGGGATMGASVSGGRVSGSLAVGTLTGCWRPTLFGAQVLGACGLAMGGWEQAQVTGFVGAHPADGPVLSAGARLLAEVSLVRKVSLVLNADPLIPIIRARATIGNLTLWQAGPISLSAGVRLAYAL